MAFVKFYFRHHGTQLLTVAGPGEKLPEITHLIVEVDVTQNRAGAAEHRSSYLFEDPHGLLIGICHWCLDLKQLGDTLGGLWWQENGRPEIPEHFVITKIFHSRFRFTNLGALGENPIVRAA